MKRASTDERKALGAFLMSKRGRLGPGDVGLPDGARRTPGLRREEVAVLAGVSVSWYTWMEQGRDIQASVKTLRRIAEVLQLDHVETAHLLTLSLREPPDTTLAEEVSEGLDLLVQAMDPVPAYVRNARFDILSWNRAVTELFLDYGAIAPHERNTIRLLFTYKPYRALILNWDTLARSYVASLRAARARANDKLPFDELAAEVSKASLEFEALWAEVDVAAFDEGRKLIRHPTRGELEYTYVALSPDKRPELSVVAYILRTPAGESES